MMHINYYIFLLLLYLLVTAVHIHSTFKSLLLTHNLMLICSLWLLSMSLSWTLMEPDMVSQVSEPQEQTTSSPSVHHQDPLLCFQVFTLLPLTPQLVLTFHSVTWLFVVSATNQYSLHSLMMWLTITVNTVTPDTWPPFNHVSFLIKKY